MLKTLLLNILQTINQFQKIEFSLKVTGPKPVTVTWFINDTTKLKSSKNRKVTYSSTSGEAKLQVMEADAEDHGPYKIVASNEFGEVSQSCMVTVVCEYLQCTFCVMTKNYELKIILSTSLCTDAVPSLVCLLHSDL